MTGLKTVNNTSILGSGNITAGGNISNAFTISASAEANLSNTASITTTAGAGAYFIVATPFGQNGGTGSINLSSTNVLDGYFDAFVWDNGSPSFTNGQTITPSSGFSVSVSGLIYTSGNITISGTGGGSKRVSWGYLA